MGVLFKVGYTLKRDQSCPETSVQKLTDGVKFMIHVVKFMISMYGIPHHCSYVHISVIKIMMSSYGLGTYYLEPGVTLSTGAR